MARNNALEPQISLIFGAPDHYIWD